MNLSPADLLAVFDEAELVGDYRDVHRAYRNDAGMMEKYRLRYGHFNKHDPAFIVAGVRKEKN